MRRSTRYALYASALFGALQFIPLARTNPPVTADFDGPPEVETILRRACYDCHSNETRWSWTAYVAPLSWLVVRDVHRARDEYNLSEWGVMDADDRAELPHEMVEEIEDGAMPVPAYLLLHPEARISDADLTRLRSWAARVSASDDARDRNRRHGRHR